MEDDESSKTELLSSQSSEQSLRSTFQRSRGIIVKRLAPFSLERVTPPVGVLTCHSVTLSPFLS